MSKATVSLSLLSSVGASLCCIAPVLAMVSGVSGLASTFSWIDPARPYLIGFSIILLSLAWYQQLRPKVGEDCCEVPKKQPFFQSTGFLAVVTFLAIVLMSFPLYAQVFRAPSKPVASATPVATRSLKQVEFTVKGMGCADCEPEVETAVNKLPGIVFVKASCVKRNTVVKYDAMKTSEQALRDAINKTGYTVVDLKR